jgi:hypothetical protein
MTEKELKRKAFLEKAIKNLENFELHRSLIKKHLCFGDKMYHEDLKIFAERQVIDNMLLIKLMEYAEEYAENILLKQNKIKEILGEIFI